MKQQIVCRRGAGEALFPFLREKGVRKFLLVADAAFPRLKMARSLLDGPVPCAVWADIAAPAGAKALCGAEDGIAADTQIVRIAAKYGKQAPAHIGDFVKEIKAALR